ncbi:MAG: ferrous iron transport protein B [Chloroflexi bacterium]|nr:ferrous iron transport protein B [Chloroflexota bacterium]
MLKKPGESDKKTIVVALAGAPNVGKSTVFNLLTGLSQHVGNWPGKTVEQKTGVIQHDGLTLQLVDLPGTYSLTANSQEEVITRDYLVTEKPDAVVVLLNAASLDRHLYLVTELMELTPRLIVALNMIDVARQEGIRIDIKVLESALNMPVVPMVASKNQGLRELVEVVVQKCREPAGPDGVGHVEYGSEISGDIAHIEHLLTDDDASPYPRHWAAMKLLEGDSQINKLLRDRLSENKREELDAFLSDKESAAMTLAGLRFDWVKKVLSSAQERPPVGRVSLTEKLDHAATHPIWGLATLAVVMGLIFAVVYGIGVPLQHFLQVSLIERAQAAVFDHMQAAPAWLPSFLGNGLLGGVGTVLTFVPILFLFFAAWGFLEDVGYTSRVAFVTDRFMHFLGLHGKSSLPLLLGFGCNVPAVMGTRIIESRRARLLTVLLSPLIPCAGRMAVIGVIAAAVFGGQAILVSLGIIVFSLVVLVAVGLTMNRFVFGGKRTALMMELPLYHEPNPRTIGLVSWQRTTAFIKRAGTLILLVSIIVWLLSYFPGGSIDTSLLGRLGRSLQPVGNLMGLNWQILVALLTSFVAKENTIATLGVLLGGAKASLSAVLKGMLTPAAAIAFLVAQVLFVPCVATVSAIRHETGGWRWVAFSVGLQLVLSFALAIAVFQIAKAAGIGV